jgi:hypothetical protein
MIVTRKSALTGKVRTKNIPVHQRDIAEYEAGFVSASEVFHYLSSADREFVMCGITDNEWKSAFSTELQKIVNDKFGVTA